MTETAPPAEWGTLLRAELQALAQRPLVWFAVALVLGIVWADTFAPPLLPLVAVCTLGVLTTAYAVWRVPPVVSRLLLVCAFLLGAALHTWRIVPAPALQALPAHLELPRLTVRVCAVERVTERDQTVVADLRPFAPGRARFSLPREPRVHGGDVLELEGVLLQGPGGARRGPPPPYMTRRGVHVEGRASRIVAVRTGAPVRAGLEIGVERTREALMALLTKAMPGATPDVYAALLASMVYGRSAAPVPDDIELLFKSSGTIHLLVASGAQVTIIALGLVFLVRGTRQTLPVWGIAAVTAGLFGFALLAGMGVSINRAVAMAVMVLGTFAWGRRYDFPTALAASALLLAVLDTGLVYDAGAQLTYACCVGIYVALPPGWHRGRGDWRHWLVAGVWGSLGAWVFATPIIVHLYGTIVFAGLLANVVAVPLAAALLYLGVIAILGGLIWLPLATPVCGLARVLMDVMLASNAFFASLPGAVVGNLYWHWPTHVLWYAAAAALCLLLRSGPLRRRLLQSDPRWVVAGGVAVLGAVALWVAVLQPPADRLRVHVLDVGAGQCVLVEAPAGTILVDAGADPVPGLRDSILRRRVLPYLALQHVRRLDAIVLSHAHEDHSNLAPELLRAIPTRRLLVGPETGAEASWPQVLQAARERHVPIEPFVPGGRLRLGEHTWLEAIGPPPGQTFRDDAVNNASLVLRLAHGETIMLFPSDIAAEGEASLRRAHPQSGALYADVLLAPHHGSGNSCTLPFLRAVAPTAVIVSCAPGERGPPARTWRAFGELGLQVWRTDVNGAITVTSDGRAITLRGRGRR